MEPMIEAVIEVAVLAVRKVYWREAGAARHAEVGGLLLRLWGFIDLPLVFIRIVWAGMCFGFEVLPTEPTQLTALPSKSNVCRAVPASLSDGIPGSENLHVHRTF